MDWGWVAQILTLLFGQMGVVGTVLSVFCGFLVWDRYREQEAHKETRRQVEAWNEKRLELHSQNLEAISQMRASINELIRVVGSRRRG